MVRSLYSGVSGLKSHQTRMDVIGNNIANVNTYGFKSSRVCFSDIYYQYQKTETGGRATFAGNNPSQVGYGTQVASIDKNMSMSNFQNSGRTFDCAIAGDGFFMCASLDKNKQISNVTYTRMGNFGIDSRGKLVNANNEYVLGTAGMPRVKGGTYSESEMIGTDPADSPTGLDVLNLNGLVWDAFKPECEIEFDDVDSQYRIVTSANASGVPTTIFTGTDPYDDRRQIAYDYHMRTAALTSNRKITTNDADLGTILGTATTATALTVGITGTGGTAQVFDSDTALRNAIGALKSGTTPPDDYSTDNIQVLSDYILYSVNGRFVNNQGVVYDQDKGLYVDNDGNYYTYTCNTNVNANGDITKEHIYTLMEEDPGATPANSSYKVAASGRQYTYKESSETYESTDAFGNTIYADMTDGSLKFKDLDGFTIGKDGILTASFANELRSIGRIEVGVFDNPEGLKEIGNTAFAQTSASGQVSVKKPGDSGAGKVESGKLEMSNVNLADEFSDMVVTQRGYQANARIITTSDSMLEELVNLKR